MKDYTDDYKYLHNKVYENIQTRISGKLSISNYYSKKVAEMLGGRYDDLTETQKKILKSDIVGECIYLEGGIDHYTRHI